MPIDAGVDAARPVASGYLKASNTDPGDVFGSHVAISADGSTVAVAAPNEASEATGIDGDQGNSTAAPGFGAVYVFARSGTTWTQQAYLKASIITQCWFGSSLALSADGSTLAVGADMDAQPTSIGAVYVFTRAAATWSQQARVRAPVPQDFGFFGWSVALSADGNTLATGAYDENSIGAPGTTQTFAGAVHVFTRSGATWTHQAALKGARTEALDYVGWSVALSGDGDTVAFGAMGESGGSTGVNGDEADNSVEAAGAVYVATRSGTTWSQQAYLKPSTVGFHANFGTSLALSSDGMTLAAGSPAEQNGTGAIYVFSRTGSTWMPHARVIAPNHATGGLFGASIAMTADGSLLAVGAASENSASLDPSNHGAMGAGAVYTFTRGATDWAPQFYLKASNIDVGDGFGTSVACTTDASTLAVGAPAEGSKATGVGGNQSDNSAANAGAAYVFTNTGL